MLAVGTQCSSVTDDGRTGVVEFKRPSGTRFVWVAGHPPVNWWAIIGGPYGTYLIFILRSSGRSLASVGISATVEASRPGGTSDTSPPVHWREAEKTMKCVPEGRLTIARRFNAGLADKRLPRPPGTPEIAGREYGTQLRLRSRALRVLWQRAPEI